MDVKQLIDEITSRDTHQVWRSACEIIALGQDPERIRPLIDALPVIEEATKNLEMGGLFAPNQRVA